MRHECLENTRYTSSHCQRQVKNFNMLPSAVRERWSDGERGCVRDGVPRVGRARRGGRCHRGWLGWLKPAANH